ncbi:MAG: MAPEG family protein [Hyphomicrobiaceae bacterium]
MPITAIYAGLLTLLLLYLSVRVIGVRQTAKVELGDGNDHQLQRRIRVHANFVEYTPYALILIGLMESLKAPGMALHVLGVTLLTGRVLHAYALSQTPHNLPLRVAGMGLTFLVLAIAAVGCVTLGLPRPM